MVGAGRDWVGGAGRAGEFIGGGATCADGAPVGEGGVGAGEGSGTAIALALVLAAAGVALMIYLIEIR